MVPPSTMTLAGLIKHVAGVECAPPQLWRVVSATPRGKGHGRGEGRGPVFVVGDLTSDRLSLVLKASGSQSMKRMTSSS